MVAVLTNTCFRHQKGGKTMDTGQSPGAIRGEIRTKGKSRGNAHGKRPKTHTPKKTKMGGRKNNDRKLERRGLTEETLTHLIGEGICVKTSTKCFVGQHLEGDTYPEINTRPPRHSTFKRKSKWSDSMGEVGSVWGGHEASVKKHVGSTTGIHKKKDVRRGTRVIGVVGSKSEPTCMKRGCTIVLQPTREERANHIKDERIIMAVEMWQLVGVGE